MAYDTSARKDSKWAAQHRATETAGVAAAHAHACSPEGHLISCLLALGIAPTTSLQNASAKGVLFIHKICANSAACALDTTRGQQMQQRPMTSAVVMACPRRQAVGSQEACTNLDEKKRLQYNC